MKPIEVSSNSVEEAVNVAKYGLFLVVQDIDRLWGYLFIRGVVIAETAEQAITKMENYLLLYPSEGRGVVFERDKLKVFEVGRLFRRPEAVGSCQSHLASADVLTAVIVNTENQYAVQFLGRNPGA